METFLWSFGITLAITLFITLFSHGKVTFNISISIGFFRLRTTGVLAALIWALFVGGIAWGISLLF